MRIEVMYGSDGDLLVHIHIQVLHGNDIFAQQCIKLWVNQSLLPTRPLPCFKQICCMSQTGQHEPLLEVTKQQVIVITPPGVL